MKDGHNVFRTTLLFCLPFDTIGPSNAISFVYEQSLFFMQIRYWKKTKTYGLVGLGAPLRQGRSLLLPTLPFQQTNRYAVDGETDTSTSNFAWTIQCFIPNLCLNFARIMLYIHQKRKLLEVICYTELFCNFAFVTMAIDFLL